MNSQHKHTNKTNKTPKQEQIRQKQQKIRIQHEYEQWAKWVGDGGNVGDTLCRLYIHMHPSFLHVKRNFKNNNNPKLNKMLKSS